MAKMAFLAVNKFFWCILKNAKQNNFCLFIVLKLNQSRNMKKKIGGEVFLQKPKLRLFEGKNKIVFKLKFQICIFTFVFILKKEAACQISQKIFIFEPPVII